MINNAPVMFLKELILASILDREAGDSPRISPRFGGGRGSRLPEPIAIMFAVTVIFMRLATRCGQICNVRQAQYTALLRFVQVSGKRVGRSVNDLT